MYPAFSLRNKGLLRDLKDDEKVQEQLGQKASGYWTYYQGNQNIKCPFSWTGQQYLKNKKQKF